MSDSQPLPLLVPPREAARLLNLSPATLYGMMARGELPYLKYGRARRISIETLHAWIAAHTVEAGGDGQTTRSR